MHFMVNIKSFAACLHAWYFHLQKGECFDQKYWNPAEGIREHNKEKAIGHSHIFGQAVMHVCGVDTGLVDGAEHTGVAENND